MQTILYPDADDIVSWCRRYCILMQTILYHDADDIVSWCWRYCIVMQTILYRDADDIVSWCRRYCIVMQTILYRDADDIVSWCRLYYTTVQTILYHCIKNHNFRLQDSNEYISRIYCKKAMNTIIYTMAIIVSAPLTSMDSFNFWFYFQNLFTSILELMILMF